jgi:hypothetical protein
LEPFLRWLLYNFEALGIIMSFYFITLRSRGTVFPQLPSAVISTVDHPLGSPSLLTLKKWVMRVYPAKCH